MSFLSRIVVGLTVLGLVLGGVAVWRLWTDQDNNTLPIGRVLNAEQIARLPDADQAPGPVIVRLGPNVFTLVNPTRRPIHYAGYPARTIEPRPRPGKINPLYDKHFRDPQGAWQSNMGFWCGTGSAALTIMPGHAGQFDVHTGMDLPPERRGPVERVGVTCWTTDPSRAQTVWSEPFVP
ncbi:MAG: hypothetical protein L0Y71_08765 [Gemmataceae bacterium]|nr:hypothetical protein [Gemmataceae bacterium]